MTRQAELVEERAIRQRWLIPEDARRRIVARLIKTATESDNDRHANIAAKTLVAAEAQNQKDEHFEREHPQKQLHLHRSEMTLPQAIEAVQQYPGYIAYLEQKAIEEAEGVIIE